MRRPASRMLVKRVGRPQLQDASGKGVAVKAWLSSLQAGMVVGILFVDEDLFHERMLIWPVDSAAGDWICITPDDDMYADGVEVPWRGGVADPWFLVWGRWLCPPGGGREVLPVRFLP